MICALWGVDLKFPPPPRHACLAPLLSPRCSRRIRASPPSPHPQPAFGARHPQCAFLLPLLISAHFRSFAHFCSFAHFAHPPSRVPRAPLPRPWKTVNEKPFSWQPFRVCRTLQKSLSSHCDSHHEDIAKTTFFPSSPRPPLTRAPRRGMLCWGNADRRPREKL